MAVYEPLIQAVRAWVADSLELDDPANEVIPAAEGPDAGPRPRGTYYVVHLLSVGQRLGPTETSYDVAGKVRSTPMRGVVRIEAFGEGGYDGLLCLLSFVSELYDPVSLTPITDVQRIAGLFSGEVRIEPRAVIDFDAHYNLETAPGSETPFVEALGLDLETNEGDLAFDFD
jgi:hypothetical protein